MMLNEIATIRNILVGKQMQELENELNAFKEQIRQELETLRTSIDQLNQKIEANRRETSEHINYKANHLQEHSNHLHHTVLNEHQLHQQAIADAFLKISQTFQELSPKATVETVEGQ